MGLSDFIKTQFLDVIEFVDESPNKLLVSKFERKYVTKSGIGSNEIRQGAQVVVRNGQAAVFVSQGQIADIFLPGRYTLETGNLPILSDLGALPSLLISPIKADLYFVNTTQFLNNRWGTKSPVILRDEDLGMVRVMSFGNFSFLVEDVRLFMTEIFGARKLNMTYDIVQFLNAFVAEAVAEAIPKMDIPVLELAANIRALSENVTKTVNEKAKSLGITITKVVVESINLPEEVEKLIDEQSGIGMAKQDMQSYMQFQTARAMRDAAKQEGGLAGLGAGVALGNQMVGAINDVESTEKKEDPVEQLKKYKELLDAGILDEEEFESLKERLLGV